MLSHRHITIALAFFVLLITPGLAGCAPFATYPPIEGSVGFDNPATEPVPSIMADAVVHLHKQYGEGHGDFTINLPAGTPADVYDSVITSIGAGRPMTNDTDWAYHITQVRSRGLTAEVDAIFPKADGTTGFLTLHMRLSNQLDNYRVQATKIWNFPAVVPPPNWHAGDDAGTGLVSEEG